jgi:hypothetical protein
MRFGLDLTDLTSKEELSDSDRDFYILCAWPLTPKTMSLGFILCSELYLSKVLTTSPPLLQKYSALI